VARKPKAITVQLVGGLGNQLFGYFAGRYAAKRLGCQVRYDVSKQDKGFSAHGSSIASFMLPEEFGDFDNGLRSPKRLVQRVSELVVGLMPKLRPLQTRIFKTFTSNEVGFDPNFESIKPGTFIRGYFQSHLYVGAVVRKPNFQGLTLRQPSSWFLELASRAKTDRPIMVHVRRGDFAKLAEEFGMLSANYYVAAINLVRQKDEGSCPIWVFSDEIEQVQIELEAAFEEAGITNQTEWILPPPGTDAAESLLLMSLGRANVISNSTFSWWSAILNPTALVVAPSKWFKGKSDPQGLIPKDWFQLASIWK
jgi:hypothetical protein